MTTIDKLVARFVANPTYLRNGSGYLAKQLKCTPADVKEARNIARDVLRQGEKTRVDNIEADIENLIVAVREKAVKFEEDFRNKTATLNYKGPKEVKTKEDLIRECDIDLSEWEITKMIHNAWGKEGNQNYQVKAWLSPRSSDTVFKEEFKDFLVDYQPAKITVRLKDLEDDKKAKVCLILPKQDAHFDKFDIAGDNSIDSRFKANAKSVLNMLKKATATNSLEEVVYIVGSDQFNAEWSGLTTKGTPQTNILPYQEGFRAICDHEVNIITTLLQYADKVKVMFIPGNHDQYVGWHLIDWLQAYLRLNKNLEFDCSIDNTKYHRYNNSGIMLNHGDALKPAALAGKFPMGFKDQWSKCENFYVFTGDKHHELSLDINGIKFYQIPQLSKAKSGWDDKNGYLFSKAEATAFVLTEYNGMSDIYKEIL